MTGVITALVIILTAACGSPATEVSPTQELAVVEATQPAQVEPNQPPASEATTIPAEQAPVVSSSDPSLPAIVTENLAGVTILRSDPFDQLDSNIWEFDPALATASSGNASITGNKSWTVGLRLRRTLLEGQAVMLKFQMGKGTNFGIQLSNGTPGTPEYRSYGFYRPQAVMLSRAFEGQLDIRLDTPLKGELKLQRFNTWYQVILGVHPNGHFYLLMWDPADPTQFNRTHDVFAESWMGKEWTYTIEIHDGTLLLDEALELQFEGIY
ncbi:MAG: hypothetical protein A2Z16_12845 [Chloroflexi bacterium RBG_16_54_18]|nr:MAG: hypothetical protein A2Z16_12845 [Chloroflexi bacterium RBG_16_54_18]